MGQRFWKDLSSHGRYLGIPLTGNGISVFGCPRFEKATFVSPVPLCHSQFDPIPICLWKSALTGWSPFIPGDADNSSLPVGGLEYTFKNTTGKELEAVFSFNAENFMRVSIPSEWGNQLCRQGFHSADG